MLILEAPTFDGYQDPWIFNNWLCEMEQFFEQVDLLDNKNVGFSKMKLIGRSLDYWNDIENLIFRLYICHYW